MALDRPEQPFYFIKVSPIELINKSRRDKLAIAKAETEVLVRQGSQWFTRQQQAGRSKLSFLIPVLIHTLYKYGTSISARLIA